MYLVVVMPQEFRSYINDVIPKVAEAYGNLLSIKLIVGDVKLSNRFYDPFRNQYRAWQIIDSLGPCKEPTVYVLNVDAYVPSLNFVFGLADPYLKCAAVFTPRLNHPNHITFTTRLAKEIVHESGHLMGLHHCLDFRCVMSFSNSIIDVDRKSWRFCNRCYNLLQRSLISKL